MHIVNIWGGDRFAYLFSCPCLLKPTWVLYQNCMTNSFAACKSIHIPTYLNLPKCQSDKKGLSGTGNDINLQASDIKYKGEEETPLYCGHLKLVNFQNE